MELFFTPPTKGPIPSLTHIIDPVTTNSASHRGPCQPPISPQYSLDRSKWMVMGQQLLCRTRKSTIGSYGPSSLIYIFLFAVLVSSALSQNLCRFEKCINAYERRDHRISRMDDSTPAKLEEQTRQRCRALRKYRRCIERNQLHCRGNLLFHSVEHINQKKLEQYNCADLNTRKLPPSTTIAPITTPRQNTTDSPPKRVFPEDKKAVEGEACTYTGKSPYRHCGMFGDPHLRTFHDQFFTCNVVKTWPLIDNDYLVVMATNIPVKNGSSATATTKITVVIKASSPCTEQKLYLANNSNLSPSFTDGTISSGSVTVEEVIPGKHVEIQFRFIGTTAIIRKVGKYLTFAIRMPHEFIEGLDPSRQLCVQGCPSPHRIKMRAKKPKSGNEIDPPAESLTPNSNIFPPAQNPQPEKRFTEEEARRKCKEIILAKTEVMADEGDDLEAVGAEELRRLSLAQSSAAFSSLVPSDDQSDGDRRPVNSGGSKERMHQLMTSFDGGSGKQRKRQSQRSRRLRGKRHRRNRNKKNRKSKRGVRGPPPCPEKSNIENGGSLFNFYFESCVFDLITTGDVNFTLSAKAALEDVRRTHILREDAPGASLEVIRNWEPLEPNVRTPECVTDPPEREVTPGNGGSRTPPPVFVIILSAMLTCVWLNAAAFQYASDTGRSGPNANSYFTRGQMSPLLQSDITITTRTLKHRVT